MRPQSVLVLGTYANKILIDIILGIGLTPLVRENILSVIDKLRHERFSAIIVDQDCANPDILELILNVRDIDEQIPVVVLGQLSKKEIRKTLASQNKTIVVENTTNGNKLAEKLEGILTSLKGDENS